MARYTTDSQVAFLKVRSVNYSYVRRVRGKLVRKMLGKKSDMTLAEARVAAVALDAELHGSAEGAVVVERAVQPVRRTATAPTLADLWQRYLTVHAKPRKKSWQFDVNMWDRYVAEHADCPANEFDLVAFHARLGVLKGKVTANRTAAMVQKMYRVAGLDDGWAGGRVQKFREVSRDRYLTQSELARLFAAADAHDEASGNGSSGCGGSISHLLRMLYYTGARLSNVCAMRWDDVREENGEQVWTIPAQNIKNGTSHTVVLCKEAVAILDARRELQDVTQYVFPQRKRGWHRSDAVELADVVLDAPMVRPSRSWPAVRDAAGLGDVRLHDLRRTLGSHLALANVSLAVIGKVLGHKDIASTQIYARLSPSAAGAAVQGVVSGV